MCEVGAIKYNFSQNVNLMSYDGSEINTVCGI